ncbi:YcaO-like family protein [Streptomyces sp. NPDC055992]|uniref:YcaO-like family protein n=1 Tax=Streptomyces sp. NPDC055992 TaxID=3345673 RepID=UPI0035DDEBD2
MNGVEERIRLAGTVRARTPEATWQAVSGRLTEYGITRVADLTGLDCVGLPVFTAIRPASRTLSTAQGKGATPLLAKLSAVMEAIELYHVEQPLPITARGPADTVAPDCPLNALPRHSPFADQALGRLVWDWTTATGVVRGEEVLLPVDLVRRRSLRPAWTPDVWRATSTGLACGNIRDEALLHALFEVVERDVLFRDAQLGGRARTPVEVTTVEDPHVQDVLDRLRAAGTVPEAALVVGPYDLPVCVAYLPSPDHPGLVYAGGGCHTVPEIALSRALTEAAQSQLTAISGMRDDLPTDPAHFAPAPRRHPARPVPLMPWPQATSHFARPGGGFATQVAAVARRVEYVTGHEPAALDLSGPDHPVHAVQVICPGTRSRIRRSMPR